LTKQITAAKVQATIVPFNNLGNPNYRFEIAMPCTEWMTNAHYTITMYFGFRV
jgi:hypothetical protein